VRSTLTLAVFSLAAVETAFVTAAGVLVMEFVVVRG